MEGFKKYLPWIIGGIIALVVLLRLRGGTTSLLPQTQIVETPQVDQFAEARANAFAGILQVVGLQVGEEGETERARIAGDVARRAQDVELSTASIFADAARRAAEFEFFSRENDRRVQQSAVDRFYSSRTTSDIIGSVNQALSGLFGGGGNRGGIFTPPTFPRGGFF